MATVRTTAESCNSSRLVQGGVRDDEQICGADFPRVPTVGHADPAMEHLDGGLGGAFMLCEAGTLTHADDGLA